MRSDLEVSFRRRGIYRKLEETGKSPVSSLYFYLFRLSRLLPVFCRWALFAQSIVRKHDAVEDFVAVCNTNSFFRLFSFARKVGASIIDPADFSVLLAAQFHSPTADPVRLCTRGRVAQVERIIHGIYRAPHFHGRSVVSDRVRFRLPFYILVVALLKELYYICYNFFRSVFRTLFVRSV